MATSATAILAGGCFWCLEAVFQRVRGVSAVQSGYIGGYVSEPSYQAVCTGNTGHAEAVMISYDPEVVSYTTLLTVFFAIHDPTTLNRQGHDVGSQYRSAIFYQDETQAELARAAVAVAQADWPAPIVTEIVAATEFYPAEIEHADYYNQHPFQPYCMAVVGPKVQKFMHRFNELLA
ncbi:peptide-methionine (S)-S-oxide reductase MsrA [Chitinibacter sp. ZOR0017]|uniref:peptide-methionine (S)-S-oxide reductase MsrA n=1 Tax=Chitinibacter sp. ZOR0017 TaxID=1339254 RepID=UPI00064597D3|nr:peptide-methionine (S)-S-oxide reductase MsrA [Chitinibacter sp. ZOR0017]